MKRIPSMKSVSACHLLGLALLFLSGGLNPAAGNANPDKCGEAKRGKNCQLVIDMAKPSSPGLVTVDAGTLVTLKLENKNPFATCSIKQERTDIAAPNFFGELRKLIAPLTGAFTGVGTQLDFQMTETRTVDEVKQAWKQVQVTHNTLSTALHAVRAKYIAVTLSLEQFYSREYVAAAKTPLKPRKYDSNLFHTHREQFLGDVEDALRLGLLPTDSLKKALEDFKGKLDFLRNDSMDQIATAKEDMKDPQKVTAAQAMEARARAILTELTNQGYGAKLEQGLAWLEGLDGLRKVLQTARTSMYQAEESLIKLEHAEFVETFILVQDRNARVKVAVSCKNEATGKALHEGLGFTLKFQDLPRLTFSIGTLVSLVEKRRFDTSSSLVSRPDGENVEANTVITQEVSRPQMLPLFFLNLRLADWKWKQRDMTFNFSNGFGVNPNSGENEAEFGTGLSLGIGGVHLFGGAHFARPAQLGGGFVAGDRVADKFAIPVVKSWETGVGFGISYRLPLP